MDTDDLKPDYKIGFLSNAGANWLDELFIWQQAFDEVVLSYQVRRNHSIRQYRNKRPVGRGCGELLIH